MLPLAVCLLLFVDVTRSQHRNSNSCPFNTMCTCQLSPTDAGAHYHDIACLGVPLYKLPELPRGRISQVDIADSELGTLQAEPLASSHIESLRLMSNNIKHIDERAFSAMGKSLASLDLSSNDLDMLPFAALRELTNLQWLNINGNQIRHVYGDWSHMQNTLNSLLIDENDISFLQNRELGHHPDTGLSLKDLHVLTTLNMDGNKLFRIDKDALPKSIQTLSLAQNLLRDFPVQLLENLPHLQWLNLRGNQIHKIPNHHLHTTIRLEKLDFGENNLRYFPKSFLNGTITIRNFILDFNRLENLPSEAFKGLNTGRILLSYNQLSTLHIRSMVGLETSLEYLALEHNKFEHLPIHALNKLKNLKYFYIASNFITEVPNNAFLEVSNSLRALSLSGNMLEKVPSNALQNCTKLRHLNLAYNHIAEISVNDFGKWTKNLSTLLLQNNRITNLDDGIFNGTVNLRELSISFNPLHYLHPDLFKSFATTLENLEISFAFNEEQFPTDVLKPLSNLVWLALDNNNFEKVPKNCFDTLQQLQYLTLESNKIRHIYPNTFKSEIHTQLTDVRFSNNKIESLEPKTFASLPNLESIFLYGNKIRFIKAGAFYNLSNVYQIVLSNNNINDIYHGAFSNLPLLTKLALQNNNLFTFSMDVFNHSTSLQSPLSINLSHNNIFEMLPPREILHIQSIDLSYNNIQEPPKYMFEKISNSLRRLYLSNNQIETLDLEAFGLLEELEELILRSNHIENVKKHAFVGLDSLQILDLSHNRIGLVHVGQFSYLQHLRVLDLSNNHLRYLPKDIFRNSKIEKLQLSQNEFITIPSSVLTDIGITLRDLSISHNNIEHVDSTMFPAMPYLLNLDLSHNRLNLLPDNVFTSLGYIQKLDLSYNPLRANYKELFHYAQSLRHLNLANIGMRTPPTLPLPNLIYLNLSSNNIEEMSRFSLKGLAKLRTLNLRNNQLKSVPSGIWNHLPMLKTLELSGNPIEEITTKCFFGLTELQHLHLDSLPNLEHFETDALSHLHLLTSLAIQTSSKISLKKILSNVTSLEKLSLEVVQSHLTDGQLRGVLNERIKHLEIWGQSLKGLDKDVFDGLGHNSALLLQIHGTQLEELPSGLVANFRRVPHLRLDLRRNQLMSLTPDVFYTNMTTWENIGTQLVSGGLLLEDNPWICDCRLVWLGHWLRRWLRESLEIHTLNYRSVQYIFDELQRARCTHPDTGVVTTIIDLRPEHMACHASALSNTASALQIYTVLILVCFLHICPYVSIS